MGIRTNVSGGAGGERWDRRAEVKTMARKARRLEDDAEIELGLSSLTDAEKDFLDNQLDMIFLSREIMRGDVWCSVCQSYDCEMEEA